MTERWKPIISYEGVYEVSDMGRIKRIAADRHNLVGRILKLQKNHDGYSIVSLCKNSKLKTFLVHRLVLKSFIGSFPKGFESNHKNGSRSDARLENLEIVTHSENQKHSYRVLNRQPVNVQGSKNPAAKLTEADICFIRTRSRDGFTGSQIAKLFGVAKSTISEILSGRIWSHVPVSASNAREYSQ